MVSFASSSLKMGKLIFMWALVSLHHQQCQEHQEPLDLSDCDDINEAVNTELLLLSNLWSGKSEGGWGGISLWSLPCQLQSQPLCSLWGDGWWSNLHLQGSLFGRISWMVGSEQLWVKGCKHGCLGPLTSIQCSVTAWSIVHQPSFIVKGSAAR